MKHRTNQPLALFLGRFEADHDGHAFVVLQNVSTGETVETQCQTEILHRNGIHVGDEFELKVVTGPNHPELIFLRLDPKPIPPDRVREVLELLRNRWDLF